MQLLRIGSEMEKKLCEELDLILSNSTHCIRGSISVSSNLRECDSWKLMKIPGDGNYLFTPLSYWLQAVLTTRV